MLWITNESELSSLKNEYVIIFYASWMPGNNKYFSMIKKIESFFKNVEFVVINVDSFKNTCVRFNVTSVPTIIFYKNNVETNRIIGIPLTSALKKIFSDIY